MHYYGEAMLVAFCLGKHDQGSESPRENCRIVTSYAGLSPPGRSPPGSRSPYLFPRSGQDCYGLGDNKKHRLSPMGRFIPILRSRVRQVPGPNRSRSAQSTHRNQLWSARAMPRDKPQGVSEGTPARQSFAACHSHLACVSCRAAGDRLSGRPAMISFKSR